MPRGSASDSGEDNNILRALTSQRMYRTRGSRTFRQIYLIAYEGNDSLWIKFGGARDSDRRWLAGYAGTNPEVNEDTFFSAYYACHVNACLLAKHLLQGNPACRQHKSTEFFSVDKQSRPDVDRLVSWFTAKGGVRTEKDVNALLLLINRIGEDFDKWPTGVKGSDAAAKSATEGKITVAIEPIIKRPVVKHSVEIKSFIDCKREGSS